MLCGGRERGVEVVVSGVGGKKEIPLLRFDPRFLENTPQLEHAQVPASLDGKFRECNPSAWSAKVVFVESEPLEGRRESSRVSGWAKPGPSGHFGDLTKIWSRNFQITQF